MTIYDIDDVMTREMWAAHWQTLVDGRKLSHSSVHRRANGTRLPIAITGNYITTDEGLFSCLMVRDTTQQEQQRQLLEGHEALKTAIVESALDGVISINESSYRHCTQTVRFSPSKSRFPRSLSPADQCSRPTSGILQNVSKPGSP